LIRSRGEQGDEKLALRFARDDAPLPLRRAALHFAAYL
jgi:hypothetical protein